MIIFKICCILFIVTFIITTICGFLGLRKYDPYHIHWYDKVGLWFGGAMIFFGAAAAIARIILWLVGL